MFGDLNKLNTERGKQQHVKKSSSATSAMPIEAERVQNNSKPSSPSAVHNTIRRPNIHLNSTDSRKQGEPQPDNTSLLTSPQSQVNRLVDQSTNQSTSQLTSQSTYIPGNRIVGRPKAFYITERLDARLDDAVKYLQEKHGIRKVDRSTIVNALLDNEANWTEENLEVLVSRVLSLLTSRLTS
jgi:hypothetical protein